MVTAGSLVTEFTSYRDNLPVTERSAAPTIPVLTAGSLVTEFTSYRDNLPVTERSTAPTIPVLKVGSPVREKSVVPMGRRQLKSTSPVRTTESPVTEICQ